MARYTLIVIDHHNNDKAQMIDTDSYSLSAPYQDAPTPDNYSPPHVASRNNVTQRVIPNYDAVADLLTPDKPEPKKRAMNSLAKRLANKPETPPEVVEESQKRKRRPPEEIFQEKYKREDYDRFNSQDLVCYFRLKAREQGIKLAVNWKRDAAQAKKTQEDLSNVEIMEMICFLFQSEQDYLDTRRLNIGILNSGWRNTIYQDTQDWKEGNYKSKAKQKRKTREWTDDKPKDGTETKIGGWDE